MVSSAYADGGLPPSAFAFAAVVAVVAVLAVAAWETDSEPACFLTTLAAIFFTAPLVRAAPASAPPDAASTRTTATTSAGTAANNFGPFAMGPPQVSAR